MPVGVVAGQPGAFQAEHDPRMAEGHLGDQLLEPFPVRGRCAGLALVDVDHGDLVRRPAQGDRLAAQVVLAQRGFGVVDDLLEAGLADIQKGRSGEVGGGHLGRRGIGEHPGVSLRVIGYGAGLATVAASATAARALTSSAATRAGSVAGGSLGALAGARPDGPGCGMTARLARARCQAVTPLPASTPNPSGNASARACSAAWRSCS
jgi:hypothetical protein